LQEPLLADCGGAAIGRRHQRQAQAGERRDDYEYAERRDRANAEQRRQADEPQLARRCQGIAGRRAILRAR
jgi:hypothetical protein